MDLERYLAEGVKGIVKGAIGASFSNPAESLFLTKFALAAKKATELRQKEEEKGNHIPPFLICSITSVCNLRCNGCYAWENHICGEGSEEQLSSQEWGSVFKEAADLGISFILLAGGEPLMREDVIEEAGKVSNVLFPIFTNGTKCSPLYIEQFKRHRNLIPVISAEGDKETTDQRRGAGVFDQITRTMEDLADCGIMFGLSVTVTTENLDKAFDQAFIEDIYKKGCRFIIFVEYVPIDGKSEHLAFDDEGRAKMEEKMSWVRNRFTDMLFIAFPGDEKSSGGCLAAGRGFFHINAKGGCEPCPFSPYSDTNVKETPLIEVMKSPLFSRLKDSGILLEDHNGGCVLYNKREEVERYEQEA